MVLFIRAAERLLNQRREGISMLNNDFDVPYIDLPFTNNKIFQLVLSEHPNLCRRVTELAIGREILSISEIRTEATVTIDPSSHSVRFDVMFKDDEKNVYDVEMQSFHQEALPKRARYYQSFLDLDTLGSGQGYQNLKKGYVIFFCTFDPFGLGLPKYTARTLLTEAPTYPYDDGAYKIFLNAGHYFSEELDPNTKAFLDYLNCGTINSELTEELDGARRRILSDAERRSGLMTLEEWLQDGRDEASRDAQKRLGALITLLLNADRIEDAKAAAASQEARDRFYEEFGL